MSATEEHQKDLLPWVRSSQGIVEIYANNMHITWSKDDMRIRLSQVITDPGTPNPGEESRGIYEERAAVTFTWRGAKILRDQLTRAIAGYEAVNGEIKTDIMLPPSMP